MKKNFDLELISLKSKAVSVQKKTPLLFIHGAWHGAWCWEEHFLDYFAVHGYDVYAPSLRGHGKSGGKEFMKTHRLADYVKDVELVIEKIGAMPVLIGHSLGGGVVQKFLETHTAPGGILLAPVPVTGVIGATGRTFKRHPLLFLKLNLYRNLYTIVATPDLAREYFFSKATPEETIRKYFPFIGGESYLWFLDALMLNPLHPKKIKTPIVVIGAEYDGIFSRKETERTAAAYGTKPLFIKGSGHDLMLETTWQEPADAVLAWLTDRGL